jgi:hypothetical protein
VGLLSRISDKSEINSTYNQVHGQVHHHSSATTPTVHVQAKDGSRRKPPISTATIPKEKGSNEQTTRITCSFVPDWWVGTIPNQTVSLIYINFD